MSEIPLLFLFLHIPVLETDMSYLSLPLHELSADLRHTGEKATLPEAVAIVGCRVCQRSHFVLLQHYLRLTLRAYAQEKKNIHTKVHVIAVHCVRITPRKHGLCHDVAVHVFTVD